MSYEELEKAMSNKDDPNYQKLISLHVNSLLN